MSGTVRSHIVILWAFLVAQWLKKKKNPRANAGDTGDGDMNFILRSGRSPREGNGNPLQYSAWKIPWTEEPGGLQSMGS